MKRFFILFTLSVITLVSYGKVVSISGLTYETDPSTREASLVNVTSSSVNITIPSKIIVDLDEYSVTSIGKGACSSRSITSVTIPNSVVTIGDVAFSNCAKLTSVTIPNSVTRIGIEAFFGCKSLTSITIGNSLTSIGERAFKRSGLISIVMPSVTSIESEAFSSCENLVSVNLGNQLKTIGSEAFYYCSSLASIVIPNSVTDIKGGAFSLCENLASVTIGNSLASIGYTGQGAFDGCSNLTSLKVVEDNPNFSSMDNVLFNKDKTELILCVEGKQGAYTVPSTVTQIADFAFYNCKHLTSVTMGNSVKSIGRSAFGGCKSLTSVTIGNSVNSIGFSAFSSCTSLTEMVCDCKKIPATSNNIFTNSNVENGTLYVPAESIELYSVAYPWYNWGKIKSIEERKPEGGGDNVCQKPTIVFANGKLSVSSNTPGAKCYYTIMSEDVKEDNYTSGEIILTAKYQITAYAIAEGYSQSATATATLHWMDATFENGSSTQMFAQKRAVLVTSNGGFISVSGLNDGERVEMFSVDGRELGSTRATGDAAVLSAKIGEAVIIRIGNDNIKAVVK